MSGRKQATAVLEVALDAAEQERHEGQHLREDDVADAHDHEGREGQRGRAEQGRTDLQAASAQQKEHAERADQHVQGDGPAEPPGQPAGPSSG